MSSYTDALRIRLNIKRNQPLNLTGDFRDVIEARTNVNKPHERYVSYENNFIYFTPIEDGQLVTVPVNSLERVIFYLNDKYACAEFVSNRNDNETLSILMYIPAISQGDVFAFRDLIDNIANDAHLPVGECIDPNKLNVVGDGQPFENVLPPAHPTPQAQAVMDYEKIVESPTPVSEPVSTQPVEGNIFEDLASYDMYDSIISSGSPASTSSGLVINNPVLSQKDDFTAGKESLHSSINEAYNRVSMARQEALDNHKHYSQLSEDYAKTEPTNSNQYMNEYSDRLRKLEQEYDFSVLASNQNTNSNDQVSSRANDVITRIHQVSDSLNTSQGQEIDLGKTGTIQTKILDALSQSEMPLGAQVSGLASKLAQSHEENRLLKSEVMRSKAKHEQLQESYETIRIQLEQRNRDIDTAKRDLRFSEQARQRAEKFVEDARKEVTRILEEATLKVEKAETSVAKMKAQSDADRSARLSAEENASKIVDEFTAKQVKLDATKVKLEESIRQSEEERRTARATINQVEQELSEFTKKAMEEVQREKELHNATKQDLTKKDNQIDALQSQVDKLQGINDAFVQEKSLMQSESERRIKDLEEEMLRRVDNANEERDNALNDKNRLSDELTKTKAKLEANLEIQQKMANEIADKEIVINDRDRYQSEWTRAIKERDEALSQCANAATRIETLMERLKESQAETEEAKRLFANAPSEKARIERSRVKVLLNDLEDVVAECEDKSSRKKDIALHLVSAVDKYNKLCEDDETMIYSSGDIYNSLSGLNFTVGDTDPSYNAANYDEFLVEEEEEIFVKKETRVDLSKVVPTVETSDDDNSKKDEKEDNKDSSNETTDTKSVDASQDDVKESEKKEEEKKTEVSSDEYIVESAPVQDAVEGTGDFDDLISTDEEDKKDSIESIETTSETTTLTIPEILDESDDAGFNLSDGDDKIQEIIIEDDTPSYPVDMDNEPEAPKKRGVLSFVNKFLGHNKNDNETDDTSELFSDFDEFTYEEDIQTYDEDSFDASDFSLSVNKKNK